MSIFGFGATKKKVSKEEYQRVRTELYHAGFTSRELNEVEKIFRADLDEPEELQRGIDSGEIERGISWMRRNLSKHIISERKIGILKEAFKKKL